MVDGSVAGIKSKKLLERLFDMWYNVDRAIVYRVVASRTEGVLQRGGGADGIVYISGFTLVCNIFNCTVLQCFFTNIRFEPF